MPRSSSKVTPLVRWGFGSSTSTLTATVGTTAWVDRDFWFSDAVSPRWFVADPTNPAPTVAEVLSTIVQVRVLIDCVGRNSAGQLGTTLDRTPRTDTGYVELDDLQFIQ